MSHLQKRQSIIQEKRKKTPFRDFVMEICSRYPLMFYKNNGLSSTIRSNDRVKVTSYKEYEPMRDILISDDLSQQGLAKGLSVIFADLGLPNVLQFTENENSEYANCVLGSKNIYLSFTVIKDVENVLYGFSIKTGSKNCISSLMVWDQSENIFCSKGIISSFNVFYSSYIKDSNNIWFCSNLIGCSECISCDGLINCSFYINNKSYSKDEYFTQKEAILRNKQDFEKLKDSVRSNGDNYHSNGVKNANFVLDSSDIENGSFLFDIHHSRNAILIGGDGRGEYIYDCFLNTPSISHIYGGLSLGTGTEHIYCSMHITGGMYIFYSILCKSCSFCLGCIGLKNKSYCILNKQYTKEERYAKVDEIFGKMNETPSSSPLSRGGSQLGEFFPPSMNPFYFNDTAAYLIDPTFTKEEVIAKGYLRRDEPIKVDIPEFMETVKTSELGKFELSSPPTPSPSERGATQTLSEGEGGFRNAEAGGGFYIDPSILKKVIVDEEGNSYRIIKMEYDFLMKYGLPLPRKHWLERMKENFKINFQL